MSSPKKSWPKNLRPKNHQILYLVDQLPSFDWILSNKETSLLKIIYPDGGRLDVAILEREDDTVGDGNSPQEEDDNCNYSGNLQHEPG